jgi:hypothetical protein
MRLGSRDTSIPNTEVEQFAQLCELLSKKYHADN